MSNSTSEKTISGRLKLYQDRWTSYEDHPSILGISEQLTPQELRAYGIFQDPKYDDSFLNKIGPDVSIVRWREKSVLFSEGDYIDVAFFVADGRVQLSLMEQKRRPSLTSPSFDPERTGIFELEPGDAEETDRTLLIPAAGTSTSDSEITFLSTLDVDLQPGESMKLGNGDIFGEIGALSGWPQSVTAQTSSECELVQIRVPALRKMRRRSASIKDRLDSIYRERSLMNQLKRSPILRHCDDTYLEGLKDRVELLSFDPDEVVARQGEEADALYMVRSGFVKISQLVGEGQLCVSYLSKGMTLGEIELLVEGCEEWSYTATSVEYSELVRISRQEFTDLMDRFAPIQPEIWDAVIKRIQEVGNNRADISRSEFLETALEAGLAQGTSMLLIDLTTCTKCDDCVKACAATHQGRPRFVREGDQYRNFLIARSCYHCRDPVCLVGCPTGAIRRSNVGDVVEIVDDICIGCSTCARNCPYDAIVMQETSQVWPEDAIPRSNRGGQKILASKCDLCHETGHDPACVTNCPHGCAVRVESVNELLDLFPGGS